MEYQVYLEINGRAVPYFEPVGAESDDQARTRALGMLRARSDASEALIYQAGRLLAVLDRSSD
jgi:hypothetical protein